MKSLIILLVAVASVTAEGQNCTPNTNFKMDCNSCVCSADGKSAACTDMACPEPRQVCRPKTQFKEYCNTCTCATDGMTYACTKMACDPTIWNRDGSLKLDSQTPPQVLARSAPRKVCKPRTRFQEYCNTCYCADDGQTYSCTRMACDPAIWNEDGSTKIELPEKPKVVESKKVCQPNTHFKKYCNSCFCSDDGTSAACTRMACDPRMWNEDGSRKDVQLEELRAEEPKKVCQPNTHFKKYCNNCFCSPDGTSAACTRMACDKRIWNEDGSVKFTSRSAPLKESVYNRQCKPGKPFKHYCNTCFCSSRGTVDGCTRMYCSEEMWNEDGTLKKGFKEQICEPGKAFSPDGCKTCVCNEDGTESFCSTKSCSANSIDTHTDKESKKWGPLYQQGDTCNPGESFYSQCNQCVCSRNGKSAFCTVKECSSQ